MSIRKHVLAGAMTLGIFGSIASPAALAVDPISQYGESQTIDVNVTIPTGGTFSAALCPVGQTTIQESADLTVQTAPEAYVDGEATGTLRICYIDTVSYRGSFDAQLQSTEFTSQNAPIDTPIDASHFTVEYTYNVAQSHWSNDAHLHDPKLADIGYFVNNADPNGQNVIGGGWTVQNSLDSARTVHYSWNGPGTEWSYGDIDVQLVLPAGTAPGDYSADLTLTLIAASRLR